ncbi:MAG: rRNA processing protein RimM [Blastocatellia bacterium]|jgi:16S rRNA processing protein RimM|nr:rRNA processing protein RimM [Blastocatellia bacterium]
MSSDEESDAKRAALAGELVAVAAAVRTRGLRGEIVAELLTDFPERFERLERLIAVGKDGSRQSLALEEHWLQSGRIILKFAGYDSVEAASALVGCEFAVPEAERVELPEDEFYDWELQGCRVETIEGEEIGRVRGVLRTGGVEVLMIDNEQTGREHLIPLAEAICVEINVEQKLIRVDAPEGLLEF